MITYSIRFDDPGHSSPHEFERKIFELLNQYSICATVAVIPAHADEQGVIPLDQKTIPHLLDAHRSGIIEIAQHGYSHSSSRMGANSEFAGVSESQQQSLILAGRKILEEAFQTKITGFVPPWNTYDQATLRVLMQAGFSYISAGWELSTHDAGLISIPRTCNIWELKGAMLKARKFQAQQPLVIAVMHHYDFKEINPSSGRITLDELADILAWLRQQPDISCKTLSSVAGKIAAEPSAWLSFHRNRAKLPWLIRKHVPREMLMKASFLRVLRSALA